MTRPRRGGWRCALLLAGALMPRVPGAASPPVASVEAVVEQPRAFGHSVGDVLEQRVLLGPDKPTRTVELPGPQRLSAWIERRSARVERSADGRYWLVVDYQVVNAPPSFATIRIPAWRLPGDASPAGRVPAWPFTVSSLTARATPGTPAWQLRPDRPAPAVATRPLRLRLLLASSALAACLAAWCGWFAWRRWRDAMTQPFAGALRAMACEDPRDTPAWRALHRAFDRTAGEVLRSSTLPRLFERAPQFVPLRGRIEDFYAQSAAHFFAGAHGAPTLASASPLALCRDLRRIERRSQR